MKFYDALQLDPGGLKAAIRQTEDRKSRRQLRLAMVVRAILIVAFSILIIAPIAPLFGAENNAVGVCLVCIILSLRFVDFGYHIGDSLVNLALTFLLLWIAPVVAVGLHPALGAPVHFLALLAIFLMTSQQPEMGNGGLYAFSYIFLTGNTVQGDLFWRRGLLFLAGFVFCGAILYGKHRKKHREVRFVQLVKDFRLSSSKCRWQLQFALGVSLLLALGSLLKLERAMWAGFACASLLGCYSSTTDTRSMTKERLWQRIVGAAAGSLFFAAVYVLVPEALHGLFGPIGGIILGFCTDYRYKTAFNCLGALLLATGLYGLEGSVLLRIANNLLGAAFGYGFFLLYQRVVEQKFSRKTA